MVKNTVRKEKKMSEIMSEKEVEKMSEKKSIMLREADNVSIGQRLSTL